MNIDIIILVVSGSSSIIIFFLKSMYEYIRSERNKIKQMRTELLKNKLSLFWLLFLHSLKHNHLSETYNLLCDGSPKSGDLSLSFNSDSDLQRIRKYDSHERKEVCSDYVEDIIENLRTIQEVYTTRISCLLPTGPICQYLIQNDKKISWLITTLKVPNKNKILFFFADSFLDLLDYDIRKCLDELHIL